MIRCPAGDGGTARSRSIRLLTAMLMLLSPERGRAQSRCTTTVLDPAIWRMAIVVSDSGNGEERPVDAVACRTGRRSRVHGQRVRLVFPTVRTVASGGVPDSRQDGALWAGRGLSLLARTGLSLDVGPLHAAVVPEVWWTENRPYQVPRGADTTRSAWASSLYTGRHSLDLPGRPGDQRLAVVTPGQSAVWASIGSWGVGISSSNVWWGPGLREGLVLGPGAAGIPRVFLRTDEPLRTPIGLWRAEWLAGTLAESRFFDRVPGNDRRRLSAVRVEWQSDAHPQFSLGMTRAVQLRGGESHLRDALSSIWRSAPGSDQLVGFSAQYATPRMRAGVEVATPGLPPGLRSLLSAPAGDVGYQLAVERRMTDGRRDWIVEAALVNTDPGLNLRDRPGRDFYAGNRVPQGWTHHGQLLGSGSGPGGTLQWLALDRATPRWSVGMFAERIRWNNEALTRSYLPASFRHDVTVRGGTRARLRTALGGHPYLIMLDAAWGTRLNYLFQNRSLVGGRGAVDVRVPQLQLILSPVP